MMCRRLVANARIGATTVEVAFVSILFFLFLFGVFEYCRFLFFQQLMTNAAREGARYAVVNSTDDTMEADTIALVTKKICGMDTQMEMTCSLYMADNAGNKIGAATDAKFGELLAVQVDAVFKPILPNFLSMDATIKMRAKALMASEAN